MSLFNFQECMTFGMQCVSLRIEYPKMAFSALQSAVSLLFTLLVRSVDSI